MGCCRKKKPVEKERKIRANDPVFNASFQYANNYIKTSKYSILTFVPINLFEQFRRVANFYFLCLLILQLIPQISSLTPITTILPLAAVLSVTAVKDAHDDMLRHKNDNMVNNRKSHILRNGKLVEEKWQKVVVGDIIRMEQDAFIAADMLVLTSSEPNGLCYIETAELDGETNLKVRQALTSTFNLGQNVGAWSKFDGEIHSEAPNNNLSKFDGTLEWKSTKYSLDNDKILYRGCVLRNTKWCYGMVVFAGKDTKLMKNSGKSAFKRTNIDRLMNKMIIGIFLFLASMCAVCTICNFLWEELVGYSFQSVIPWEEFVPGSFLKGRDDTKKINGSLSSSLLMFFSYVIILNTVVPISLYVSVEMIRIAHSVWINWDIKMYYRKNNTPAFARTTTLNEELGQIKYIFSDKTGTLTQNIMAFNKCSINCKQYGYIVDEYGNRLPITEHSREVNLSSFKYNQPSFKWYDQTLVDAVRTDDRMIELFFRNLAICHTVMSESKNDELVYQAQSPDENALVGAARNFGYVFKSRTPESITIEVNGREEVFELLAILDFNNVRKRMSVIVRRNGRVQLFCKGADTVIYERIDTRTNPRYARTTTDHLNDFAQDGLRTLCLAYRDISDYEWDDWSSQHHEAKCALEDRDDKVEAVYELIEKDMTLIGATAIEDKLQDGVPEAISGLGLAGIKIWVLTGDKQETAINIGYACNMLTEDMKIYVVDGETDMDVRKQLSKAHQHMNKQMGLDPKHGRVQRRRDKTTKTNTSPRTQASPGRGDNKTNATKNTATTVTVNYPGSPSSSTKGSPKTVKATSSGAGADSSMSAGDEYSSTEDVEFGLVITGGALVYGLRENTEKMVLAVGSLCKAVICCRVTPLQKAQVVELIKRYKHCITLAIGDGANDVSMIKAAHIGVGISGQEGLQAVLASDYSMAQFRYLERLLLVHGRWSYLRMCKFLRYFFYKNFAFTLCNFWFAFFCGFTAQALYDEYFIMFYNLFFTSCPVIILAAFEKDVDDRTSLRYPRLYHPGHVNLLFNKKVFLQGVSEGFLTAFAVFFIPYGIYDQLIDPRGHDLADLHTYGFTVASSLVTVVTLRCAIEMTYWTPLNHMVTWTSLVFFFLYTYLHYSPLFIYTYVGSAEQAMKNVAYWLTLCLTTAVLIVPIIAIKFFYVTTRPTLSDVLRTRQKRMKKDISVPLRPTTGMSRRSFNKKFQRSGYAFSHTKGFGNLITSGVFVKKGNVTTGATTKSPTRLAPASSLPKSPPKTSHNNTVNSSLEKSPTSTMNSSRSPFKKVSPPPSPSRQQRH